MTSRPLSDAAENSRSSWVAKAAGRKIVLLHLTQKAMTIDGGDYIAEILKKLMADENLYFVASTDQRETQGSRDTIDYYRNIFLENDRCIIHDYESIDGLIGLIEAADLAITTKLHVGILSLARGTPVLSFPYHDKTLRFYRQVGFEQSCLPYSQWTQTNIKTQFERFYNLQGSKVSIEQSIVDKALQNREIVQQFAGLVRKL